MQPLISVIITTHQRPVLLRRAIESVLQQGDLAEIILCSDESSLPTAQVATELLRPSDSFLRLPQLRGLAETRNMGMMAARGQWVCFLDDDDSMEGDFFARLKPMLTAPDEVVYTNFTEIREDILPGGSAERTGSRSISLAGLQVSNLAVQNFIPVSALIIPRRHLKSVSFDPSLKSHEDWDLILQLRKQARFRHADISGPNYHISSSATRNDTGELARAEIYQQIYLRHKLVGPRIWKRRIRKLLRIRSNATSVT
ncbi:glycosyltransferase family 2 protein [Paracoccus benzoatiresistens]|uniref:Glycosyltransferase family 2 protein n=1 Tax=Paracoccus benzoatiresistens TaxID=2997341 RepID=A0ABT4IYR2_9RHOB|nr:glycosyltransferase family 2 protein [Paracoccus sp. EF6]MCZ0960003.1 glycosyltransferase family 2 protein [Paracoccus sp. EF6]